MCAFAVKSVLGTSSRLAEEWLVTDRRGGFAMGTTGGVRTRKYHSFYSGIAGRAETVFLADIELKLNGRELWPHRYASDGAPVIYPDPLKAATAFAYEPLRGFPRWRWMMREGCLSFGLEPGTGGGMRMKWRWQGDAFALLEVRPFWSMRTLHGMGGKKWELRMEDTSGGPVACIGGDDGSRAWCALDGPWIWQQSPVWHHQFLYTEEVLRGYDSQEDLYSAGFFKLEIASLRGQAASWTLVDHRESALAIRGATSEPPAPIKALDFVLHEPAGVCAGYPWFGEWGRDTFIALPGLVAAWGEKPAWNWAREVLSRWGAWILSNGMIPNVLEKGAKPQWDSADGTLWWCHALAALWAQGLAEGKTGSAQLQVEFAPMLTAAISSIQSGKHLALRPAEHGLLEVTAPHATWMDARVNGVAVTPRTGRLPEINALWFQARCLDSIWSHPEGQSGIDATLIEQLGRAALDECDEADRPNRVFLHSLPLAPSFVLRDASALSRELKAMSEHLCTPVGLRTLSPLNPEYLPSYLGSQLERDLGYHQGPPWAWLGGHYQMACSRLVRRQGIFEIKYVPGASEWGSVPGHVAELFDAEPPFIPRGAPAQAWSLACFEEAAARRRLQVDAHLTRILAQRWLAHLEK